MKSLKTIYYIFLACLATVAVLLLVSVFPITGNIKILTVLSGSMEPAIHMGSVVIIKPVANYNIGDVITFGPNTKTQIPTTHRIAEIRVQEGQTVYKTQGDANNAEDIKEVSAKDILGKVYLSVPYAGYMIDFVKTPWGMILVIILPAIFIIYDEVKKIVKEIGKMKKMKNKSIHGELLMCLILGMLVFNISGTRAYFNDTESSTANSYTAGTLGLTLTSTGNFSAQLTPTQNSLRDITVAKQGSLDFKYRANVSNLSGGYCQNINLKATLNSVPLYDGSLTGFNIATSTDLGAINFVASSNAHGFNQTCDFSIVFTAWQVNLDNENIGFSDEKSISNSIIGGQDQNDVVLNEFLPNPTGDDSQTGIAGEWVEFYNNSDLAIDMTGWYTENSVGASNRRTVGAGTAYSGQTIIGAKGSGSEWLVLFMSAEILNNTADTVNLYDNYGGLVDTHSYSGSNYNVNDTPGATNNLIAYLPFNNDLLDKSGNNNNGANYGTSFTSISDGKAEQALDLTGSQYVEVPDSSSLDITNQITLEAWVYPTAWSPNENSILTKAGDGEYGVWNLHYKTTTNGFRFELNNSSGSHALLESTPSTALDTWYHVVGVYDGTTMELYVNGVLKGSLATSGSIVTNNSPLRIGKQFWWGSTYSSWTGRIDEAKVYNRALSATEVLEHYNTVNDGETSIPVGKSFARIPDGTGPWIDPIPTPGGPNKNEEKIPEIPVVSEQSLELATSTIPTITFDTGTSSPEVLPNSEQATTTPSMSDETATTTPETATTTAEIIPGNSAETATSTDSGQASTTPPIVESNGVVSSDPEQTASDPELSSPTTVIESEPVIPAPISEPAPVDVPAVVPPQSE